MAEILEVIMIVSFGASWPLNVIKSYKARTTKGKSLAFLLLILFGYVAGIISKFVNEAYIAQIGQKWYVLFFYFLNFTMVSIDLAMYVRNRRLDKLSERSAAEA
jgi:alkyl hydroperoxide reductase subunit AhpC